MSKPIESLNALHGCELRHQLQTAIELLGEPDARDLSPIEDNGDQYSMNEWQDTDPPMSILAWLPGDEDEPDSEYIWGVRLLSAGTADPDLGFAVGDHREKVKARCPECNDPKANEFWQPLENGHLYVEFENDLVTAIQLLAPMDDDPQ